MCTLSHIIPRLYFVNVEPRQSSTMNLSKTRHVLCFPPKSSLALIKHCLHVRAVNDSERAHANFRVFWLEIQRERTRLHLNAVVTVANRAVGQTGENNFTSLI